MNVGEDVKIGKDIGEKRTKVAECRRIHLKHLKKSLEKVKKEKEVSIMSENKLGPIIRRKIPMLEFVEKNCSASK